MTRETMSYSRHGFRLNKGFKYLCNKVELLRLK